jgi:hypothetical protein
LRAGAGVDVGDVGLLVAVVGEHLVIELGALVAGRAARGLDVGFVGRSFRLLLCRRTCRGSRNGHRLRGRRQAQSFLQLQRAPRPPAACALSNPDLSQNPEHLFLQIEVI